ncbi:MAG: dTMP kinase [Chloroflexi bacterium]|nr:dTMP kinase [Chloroflexota bacterium]
MPDDSFFFVIEGMDGAGKSSIAAQLHEALSQTHRDRVVLTFEPHDPSAAGKYIRKVLAKEQEASPRALALAFALNRVDHLDQVINPALNAGEERIVICDRYVLSSLVYQSTGGLSMEDVHQLNRWARVPDLTVYLSVSPHNGYARMRGRPTDRELFERNLSERAEKYQAGIALLRDKGERIIEIDANPAFDQVLAAVLDVLKDRGPAWLRIQPPLLLDWHESEPAK